MYSVGIHEKLLAETLVMGTPFSVEIRKISVYGAISILIGRTDIDA